VLAPTLKYDRNVDVHKILTYDVLMVSRAT
jgi:hypothetical protein